jgi:probable F420-dependent oxidoreductase
MAAAETSFKVGVQVQPQHGSIDDMRGAWREADAIGVDTLWNWDHFYPLYGEPDGAHFESWTQLAAMACETSNVRFGALVTCLAYRNVDLLADMARTIDHLSGGRFILGIGAGWFKRDFDEYGYEFGTPGTRLAALDAAMPRLKARLAKLNPPPLQRPLPILIGGGGEKVTLRIVAEHADMWNGFGPIAQYSRKNAILDEWCEKVGRDPAAIERTVHIDTDEIDAIDGYLEIGVSHFILGVNAPYDLDPVRQLLKLRG